MYIYIYIYIFIYMYMCIYVSVCVFVCEHIYNQVSPSIYLRFISLRLFRQSLTFYKHNFSIL